MEKIDVTCIGCGKKHQVSAESGHMSAVKCECGATFQVKNDPSSFIKDLGPILDKIPGILGSVKQTRRQGVETGMDEAIHEVTKEIVQEVLKESPALREALKDYIREGLETMFAGDDEGGEEEPPRR